MSMELGPYTNFHELNLDWFLNEFNKVLAEWTAMNKRFSDLNAAFNDLRNYVHDYFKNLNVQEEIDKKLDSMASNGELTLLLEPTISSSVNKWMTENITQEQSVIIDKSLTVNNACANSKTVGDFIGTSIEQKYNTRLETEWKSGFVNDSGGLTEPFTGYVYTEIAVNVGETYLINVHPEGDCVGVAYYNSDSFIRAEYKGQTEVNTLIVIPENCNKIRVSSRNTMPYYINVVTPQIEQIDKMKSELEVFRYTDDVNHEGYVSGFVGNKITINENFPNYSYVKKDISGIDYPLYISANTEGAIYFIITTDSDGNIIRTIDWNDGRTYITKHKEEYFLPIEYEKFLYVNNITYSGGTIGVTITKKSCSPNNSNRITAWGDSLTYGVGANKPYTKYLSDMVGRHVTNYGCGGETSIDIANRQGGIPFEVEPFTANINETKNINIIQPKLFSGYGLVKQANLGLNPVLVNGTECTLNWNNGEKVYTITPISGGVNISKNTYAISYFSKQNDIEIYWVGTNDNYDKENEDRIIKQVVNCMVNSSKTKRYIVIGLTCKNYFSNIENINAKLAVIFGNHFCDARTYLLTYGLSDNNITPTQQDLNDISNGEIPSSLRSDVVHLNDSGYKSVANSVYRVGKLLEYW